MVRILVLAAALVPVFQAAQAQTCPKTLQDIQWAQPAFNAVTVTTLLDRTPKDCHTPVYFGLHRGNYTRGMDLTSRREPVTPSFSPDDTVNGFGFVNATLIDTNSSAVIFPVFPQSLASIAIPAYQQYVEYYRHLPDWIDPTLAVIETYPTRIRPTIIELDPRQDVTGTWYLFHGVFTNADAWTPLGNPNDPTAPLPTATQNLGSQELIYRAAPILGRYAFTSNQYLRYRFLNGLAKVGDILDLIATDERSDILFQLHTRGFNNTIQFYQWLLTDWARHRTTAQITRALNRIYFCIDLNKFTPGEGGMNDYNNLKQLPAWNDSIDEIADFARGTTPNLPNPVPPVGLMINYYDDTNLLSFADVTNNVAILDAMDKLSGPVRILGLEITDENSAINANLQSLGRLANRAVRLNFFSAE